MSDQVVVVLGLAVATALVIGFLRLRPVLRPRRLTGIGLDRGVYLLTSHGCESCEKARARLARRGTAFTEIAWQDQPEVFDRGGIDAVPSVLEVLDGGVARWWRGGVPLVGLTDPSQIPGTRGSTD